MVKAKQHRTKRLRAMITRYLQQNGTASTRQLLDHINTTTRMGSTMNILCNVLSKDPNFRSVGSTKVSNHNNSGKYKMLVWGLAEEEE